MQQVPNFNINCIELKAGFKGELDSFKKIILNEKNNENLLWMLEI